MALTNEEINARRRAKEALNRDAVRAANNAQYRKHAEKRKAAARGYYALNTESCKRSMRRWVANNRGRVSAIIQNYYARKRENGGTLSPDLLDRLMVEQQGLCKHCGADLNKVGPQMDHIIAVANGGPNIDSNIQLLCRPCNSRKGAK